MRARRGAATVALAVGLATGLGGCGLSGGAYDLPLPGGADVGSSPYTLVADFSDVMDLVPQASVKVDDVAVGRVSRISLNTGGRSARVRMTLNSSVRLPEGTTARLEQTSLLGEKYVALVRPEDQGQDALGGTAAAATVPAGSGYLEDGDRLPLDRTSQAVGVEQVLGALSALLSGGGLGQFQEISRELQQVSDGRPEEIRAFLERTKTFVAELDARRDSITTAIDGLAQLSATLEQQRPQIVTALDGLNPGLEVLRDQRAQLVKMLEALDKLSKVSVSTLDRAQDDIVADFKLLDPILTQLARSGSDLPKALEILITFPFPDSVLGAIKGDYLNVFSTVVLTTDAKVIKQPDAMWPKGTAAAAVLGAGGARAGATPSGGASSSPPMILPTTSSALPGSSSPTVPVPSGPSSSGSGSTSPSPSGSGSPTGSGSPSETPNSTSPGSSESPGASSSSQGAD